jgi:hypothetical protein
MRTQRMSIERGSDPRSAAGPRLDLDWMLDIDTSRYERVCVESDQRLCVAIDDPGRDRARLELDPALGPGVRSDRERGAEQNRNRVGRDQARRIARSSAPRIAGRDAGFHAGIDRTGARAVSIRFENRQSRSFASEAEPPADRDPPLR